MDYSILKSTSYTNAPKIPGNLENIPYGIWGCDAKGDITYLSQSFLKLLNINWSDAEGRGWLRKLEQSTSDTLLQRWNNCISKAGEWEEELALRDEEGRVHIVLSKGAPVFDDSGTLIGWSGINLDITHSRQSDQELKNLEWLLTHKHRPFNINSNSQLTSSSTKDEYGEIQRSVGREMLLEIAGDFFELLDSSAFIFEKNGTCAISIISSPWCKLLCQMVRNQEATESKDSKCSCYGSCRDAAMDAIGSGEPVERVCPGGIDLFAVPVRAGAEIIGAIVLGLGNPPRDPRLVKQISEKYGCDYQRLQNICRDYKYRPEYIIDYSKSRLFFSARLIGTIVERYRAEAAFHKTYTEVERRVELRTAALSRSYELLREETRERMKAEQELFQKHTALESVYSIATEVASRLEDLYDRATQSITSILQLPYAAVGLIQQNQFRRISQNYRGKICRAENIQFTKHPCGIVMREQNPCQFSGDLNTIFPEHMENFLGLQSFIGVPILSNKKEVLGIICAMDLDSRVFTEYEFHQIEIFSRFLAREIEQRQLEKQLRANQEMKMLGLLTSGVAHEVRNPLNGILAITEALNADLGDNPEYNHYINHIRNQVTRLSDLMRDLLDLGRPVEKTNLQACSIQNLIKKTLLSWSASSKHKNRKIIQNISTGAERCVIYADKAKMQQVFINLLENACDHSRSETTVTICVLESGNNVLIRIIDQGNGIKEEYLEHLFEPFFTTRKGGTGLGLGIVKRIVESHGGSIKLKNNIPPPGCTAEICLTKAETDVLIDDDTSMLQI